jgi:class 3 adenylate cyclase/TolB-like protein
MSEQSYTRQLTTILSVDAVGYSKLTGVSEELALERLVERRGIITEQCEKAGGRMFGVAGDSMMAEFGAPADAIRAAIEFQSIIGGIEETLAANERLPFRAGINTGDVLVRDGSLFGDEVNIAARLQEIAAPGGIVVSATAFHNAEGRVAAQFVDLGERALKNIGVRVRAYAASRAGSDAILPVHPGPVSGATPASAVAVLPFSVDGLESDFAYLGDGLADDIIIGLSNTRWLPVIARSSSFQFRDSGLGTVGVAHSLGARYVVSGALSRSGEQLHVKAVLEDSATALVLWSKRFELPLDAVSELQQSLGKELVAALEKQVDRAEMVRAFRTPWEQAETWRLVQRGRWHMHRRTRADTDIAHALFTQALELDPNSSMALDELAWWHIWRAWLRIGDTDELDMVDLYAGRALFMDSQDARPHCWLGTADIMRGKVQSALDHLAEAVRLNPSFAYAHAATGTALTLAGRYHEAIPHTLEAWRLSPFDLYGFHNFGELAAARLFLGDNAGALEAAERSLRLSPRYFYAALIAITALWRLGRQDDARRVRARLDAAHPGFSSAWVERIPFQMRDCVQQLMEGYLATSG